MSFLLAIRHNSTRKFSRWARNLVCLLIILLGRAVPAQEVIPLTALSGYTPNALWVEVFLSHFIPEADRQLASRGNYAIDWNTPFGTVARPGGAFDAIQYDLGDIGIIVTPFHADKLPFFNISYVTPFVTTDIGLVVRTVSELNDRYPELKRRWHDYRQVYLVTAGLVDTYQAVMKRPISGLDDFRGSKMSGVGMNLRYFEGLGAVGVSSSVADFYTNMATGLTAGAIVWPEAIMSYRLNEVGPYLIDVRLGSVSSVALSANQRTWERLPGDVQAALLAASVVYRDELARETVRRSRRAIQSFKEQGGKIISLSAEQRRQWAASIPDLAGAWVEGMESKGLPGRRILQEYMDIMRANGQPVMRHWDRKQPVSVSADEE